MAHLSLEEIVQRVEDGQEAAELLKSLDVSSCHFGPTLREDATTPKPLVQTNVVGGGSAMTGILTHDILKAKQMAESGQKAIWVGDTDYFDKWAAYKIPVGVGLIYLPNPAEAKSCMDRCHEAHFRLRAAYRSFLIDKQPPEALF